MSNIGFVIGDQFSRYLFSLKSASGSKVVVWGLNPALAKVYPTLFDASRVVKRLGGDLMVFQIDETKDKYYLTSV